MKKNRSQTIQLLFLVGGVIIYLLILTSCSIITNADHKSGDDLDPWIIEIDPAHQTCENTNDCTLVYIDCSSCSCGTPINLAYESFYTQQAEQICQDYVGPVCEMYCPEATLVCLSGLCVSEPFE
jgi:hypothetical protein